VASKATADANRKIAILLVKRGRATIDTSFYHQIEPQKSTKGARFLKPQEIREESD
jgi:hypothetical protein